MDTIIFEEHSSVLPEWKSRGVTAKTLVCFDAHLDFKHIASQRIKALRRCRTATEIVCLEKPHFLAPDGEYSFDISDFVYAGYQLGFLEGMVWVCPGHSASTLTREITKKLQQLECILGTDLKALEQHHGYLSLKLLGLPVTICCYPQLGLLQLPRNVLLDVDIDYFVSSQTRRPWIDPRDLYQSVRQLGLNPEFVSITRSVRSGYMPLQYRYLADYLEALFREDQRSVEHYSRLYEWDQQGAREEPQTCQAACHAEALKFPECPATHYLLSSCSTDERQRLQAANVAEGLCSEYRRNALRSACERMHSAQRCDAAHLDALEKEAESYPLRAPELHWFYAAMALLCSQCKDRARSRRYYNRYRRLAGEHPALQYSLGLLFYQQGWDKRAHALFLAALREPSLRGRASLQLASLHLKHGNYLGAAEYLQDARVCLPASPEPARLQGHVYKRMGDMKAYRAAVQLYLDLSCLFLQRNADGLVSSVGI